MWRNDVPVETTKGKVVGERKTQTGRTKVASANDPRKVTCDSARVSGTLAGSRETKVSRILRAKLRLAGHGASHRKL